MLHTSILSSARHHTSRKGSIKLLFCQFRQYIRDTHRVAQTQRVSKRSPCFHLATKHRIAADRSSIAIHLISRCLEFSKERAIEILLGIIGWFGVTRNIT